jgi:trehalose/maltose hydrolase-like predicted phosphorylase
MFPLSPTDDASWHLKEDGFNPIREHEFESLFALSNGYAGSRGSLAEGGRLSDPATFIAGIYDTHPSATIPELAAAPDWMMLRLTIDGRDFRLDNSEFVNHRRLLDFRTAVLWRELLYRDAAGGVLKMQGFRLTSLADRHVLLQSLWLRAETRSLRVNLRIVMEPVPDRPGRVRLAPVSCAPLPAARDAAHVLELRTRRTGVRVALATVGQLRVDQAEPLRPHVERAGDRLSESWEIEAVPGKTYRLDRFVVVYTSRDCSDPAAAAARHLDEVSRNGVQAVFEAHARAWERRWRSSDIEIRGDEPAQRALRFASYHLIGAADPDNERVSIGARALTGAAYKGHVFWDTEIFMLPFYLFTHPPSARALLMYRYHTLPAARKKAERLGFRGALYAWESTDTGEETTPSHAIGARGEVVRILSGEQEHHIAADVAYAVWHYWQASGDDEFLRQAGAEILLETARFWASRGRIDADGLYHIRRVIGPDEYHESVDDNAYTNGMAQWNLERAAETARLLAARWPERWSKLAADLNLTGDEPDVWEDLARRMYTGFDPHTGLFEQFAGFFRLEDINLAQYAPHTVPLDVILGRARTQSAQVVKQADVLMLIYLLWERFTPEVRAANFRYYAPRTAHGSSLSPSIHACLAARLGLIELAMGYFRRGAEIDLSDNMGNAAGGVHAAALGGLWQAAVLGFAGLRLAPDGLAFAPHSPPNWPELRFPVRWRGSRLRVRIQGREVDIAAEGKTPVTIQVGEAPPVRLESGSRVLWRQTEGGWQEVPEMEMRRIVLWLDKTPPSASVLAVARVLAEHLAATPVVVSDDTREALLEAFGRTVPQAADLLRSAVFAEAGRDAAGALAQAALAHRCPCIVLPLSDEERRDSRPGSVAEAVLQRVSCPVLLVPHAPEMESWTLRRMVLPQDGTPETARALGPALHWARRAGANLLALHVSGAKTEAPEEPGAMTAPQYIDQPQHEWPAWGQEFLDRVCFCCLADDLQKEKMEMFFATGEPGPEIIRFARDHGGDLIVLPWRGSLAPDRAATFRYVLRNAFGPILVLTACCPAG